MHWIAIYDDNSQHTQEELKSSSNVDRGKLKEFRLYNGERCFFICKFTDKSRKLIFRKRTLSTVDGQIKGVVYLVGWHKKIGNESVKSICYIYEDGHIEFDDARNNLELLPCEL